MTDSRNARVGGRERIREWFPGPANRRYSVPNTTKVDRKPAASLAFNSTGKGSSKFVNEPPVFTLPLCVIAVVAIPNASVQSHQIGNKLFITLGQQAQHMEQSRQHANGVRSSAKAEQV